MTLVERIQAYIHQLCSDVGVDPASIYNPATNAWYFSNGSATMEVFLTTQKGWDNEISHFLRIMAPLCEIPRDVPRQFNLFKTVMAINQTYLGFKIGADEQRNLICIVAERNIQGMDYSEMVDMIDYLGHWANKLDDFMKAEFPV